MGKLKIKIKNDSYMKKHGYVVINEKEKPPKKQNYIVVNDKGERIK